MPDASFYKDLPLDWADACDRLPLATPDASAWPAMAHALHAHQSRRTRMRWIALAAGVAAVAALPVIVSRIDQAPARRVATQRVVSAATTAIPTAVTSQPITTSQSDVPLAMTARESGHDAADFPAITNTGRTAQLPEAFASSAPRVRTGQTIAAVARGTEPSSIDPSPAAGEASTASLASLQAESAQLEQLLTLARDERVASGVTVSLRDAQLERIASIDAALVDDSDPTQRIELWEARVEALRDATAFEGSRRWRGAQGLSMDAALVRVD